MIIDVSDLIDKLKSNTLSGRDIKLLFDRHLSCEWVSFWPENITDTMVLGDHYVKNNVVYNLGYMNHSIQEFNFRQGANEGYILDISVYSDEDKKIGKLSAKFLSLSAAREALSFFTE